MLSLLRLERKQKSSSKPFLIRLFLFLSYSFGIETTNTFIHSVVPSKTILDSRPKWAKCIPIFRPNGAKTLFDGAAHTHMAYIREYSPPPPGLSFALVNEGLLAGVRFILYFKSGDLLFQPSTFNRIQSF